MKLWKDNRLDGEYEASLDELAGRFLLSEWADVEQHPMMFEHRVAMWLAEDESAVADRNDQRLLEDYIWDRVPSE
jgi:hypothetical protein